MKILFAKPPSVNNQYTIAEDCCRSKTSVNVLPAGLLSIASEAKQAGHNVEFVDLSIDKQPLSLCNTVDLLVFPIAWHNHEKTYNSMLPYIENAKQIVAWVIPSGYAEKIVAKYPKLYSVVFSEPEQVFRYREVNRFTPGTCSVIKGRVCKNKQLQNNIDLLGNVDYTLVKPHYWRHYKQAIYQVTRGCKYRCTFCLWGGSTTTDKAFKVKSPDTVVNDLNNLRKASGRTIPLYLLSSSMTFDINWLRSFSELMQGNAYYPYRGNVNLSELNTEVVELLKDSDMVEAMAGLEAMTDVNLSIVNKPHRFEQALHGIRFLEYGNLRYRLHIRCGFGETENSIIQSIDNLYRLAEIMTIGKIDIAPLVHYDGTIMQDVKHPKYKLESHPSYKSYCPIQKDISKKWAFFASEAARLGILHKRGVIGFNEDWLNEYRKQVGIWKSHS